MRTEHMFGAAAGKRGARFEGFERKSQGSCEAGVSAMQPQVEDRSTKVQPEPKLSLLLLPSHLQRASAALAAVDGGGALGARWAPGFEPGDAGRRVCLVSGHDAGRAVKMKGRWFV